MKVGLSIRHFKLKWDLMCWLIVILSQLHLNNQAYIRCFKLVCKGFKVPFSETVFFFSITSKLEVILIHVIWVVSLIEAYSLFLSHKYWKHHYLKVCCMLKDPFMFHDKFDNLIFHFHCNLNQIGIKFVDEDLLPLQ